mmetsp:Transcript_19954/g.49040  ORF Transcript_19954/g.49040 Transcript_19954/m.49040 type:complete len:136 (+) Transcript_19954:36-443(+)
MMNATLERGNSFGSDGDENQHTRRLKVMSTTGPVPQGWRLATKEELRENFSRVRPQLEAWVIAELADGYQVNGPKREYRVEQQEPGSKLGHRVLYRTHAVGPARMDSNGFGIDDDDEFPRDSLGNRKPEELCCPM